VPLFFALRAQEFPPRAGTRVYCATGARRGLYRRTAAGSAAASEIPALRYAFLLFLEKEKKLQKEKEAQGAFYKPPP
jgi:hypothetical protein